MRHRGRAGLLGAVTLLGTGVLLGATVALAGPVQAATLSASGVSASARLGTVSRVLTAPTAPVGPTGPTAPAASGSGAVTVQINGINGKPSSSVVVILGLTVLSVAPALLLMCTSFTKIIIVLSLTRNALGLTNVPPNQVLAGIALFLSLFIMGPVLSQMNHDGLQPYMKGTMTQAQAFDSGVAPLKTFMLARTRTDSLGLFERAANPSGPIPATASAVPLTTLVPAFVLSELKSAFIIGFVIFIPFMVIDLVVSATLMSMGMMMLPPVMISLPFKMLLFVLVDGWGLVVSALVASYR
ncbi:MAG: flagellar type III secretion system pore protein FliP [Actinomycetes bacterium]